MAEEKAEKNEEKKKTPGVAKLVFKWIGVGVVCVLLLGAVVLQAPWKVTTLLVIILAACTVLPKPARKWFWASVGVVILGCIVWVFLPEADGDWRPYTFEKELAAFETKYIIPDEENAALIYYELFDEFEANSFGQFLYDEDHHLIGYNEFWTSEEHPKLMTWIEGQHEIIEGLIRASEFKECRFSMRGNFHEPKLKPSQNFTDVDAFFSIGYSSEMWTGGKLLVIAGNNDVAENRFNEALKKYLAAMQIGEHLRQQPHYEVILTGARIQRDVYRRLNQFLLSEEHSKEHVNFVASYLKTIEYKWDSDFNRIIESEKLFYKTMSCGMAYETNAEGRIRLNQDPNSTLRKNWPAFPYYPSILRKMISYKVGDYFDKRFTKADAIICWFFMPSKPEKAGQIVEEGVEKFWAMDGPELEAYRKVIVRPRLNYRDFVEIFLYYFLGSCDSVYKRYHEAATEHKGCQLTAALCLYKNKYGHWPEKLDEVKEFSEHEMVLDSFNNTPFVYKLTDDNFKLYSVGMNNIDEDGEYDADSGIHLRGGVGSLTYKEDDILIWPPRSRKAKEENADDEQQ